MTLVNYQVVVQKVTVQTRIPSHCNWQGLAGDLGRALLYILDNALEAMTEASSPLLTLVVDRSGANYCIRIVDSGVGVPSELSARLFEPFFTTKGPPHSGIGLYLADEIIRRVGGKIECVSPSPLGRTEFTIFLPAA